MIYNNWLNGTFYVILELSAPDHCYYIYTLIVWTRETRSLCKRCYFTEDRKQYRFGTT